ncbi:DUF5658 family protein [Castellaniella sp. S9]|uniref:DUF5658 family protein n=1 Tax=Castellaniella sp. S9 TaxID=2993652 RepID=UPI003FA4817F
MLWFYIQTASYLPHTLHVLGDRIYIEHWLYVLFLATQRADAVLTTLTLNRGGRELNPIMRWAMGRIGVVPTLFATKVVICAAIFLVLPWMWTWVMFLLCLWYVWVCGWNASQYIKLR